MTQQSAIGSSTTTTALGLQTNARLYATAAWGPGGGRPKSDGRQYPSALRQVSFSTDEESLRVVPASRLVEEDCDW